MPHQPQETDSPKGQSPPPEGGGPGQSQHRGKRTTQQARAAWEHALPDAPGVDFLEQLGLDPAIGSDAILSGSSPDHLDVEVAQPLQGRDRHVVGDALHVVVEDIERLRHVCGS